MARAQRTLLARPLPGAGARTMAAGLGLAVASALIALTACSKEPAEKEPTVTVQVATAAKKTLHQTVTAQAILFPRQQAAITPKISAPVRKFLVNRGSAVHAGQLLAVLEQAQAAYETTTAASLPEDLQKAQLDADAAKKMLDAQEKVYQSRQELFHQGALPRKELDQALVDVTQARNQYEIAQKHYTGLQKIGTPQGIKSAAGQLQSARGRYLGAEAQLSYSEIRSPIDGVITDRPLYPGEMAAAGTPLITVMDTSSVIAKAHIPQTEAALLQPGDPATLNVPGEEEAVAGKVTIVSPALDPNSTTVEVWVQAPNRKARLKPGTSVQVSVLAKTVDDAVAVPAAAVLTAQDGATTVMVAGPDGRAHQVPVKTGVRDGDQVQIVAGIQPGDKVVAAGAYALPDKTKITVEASALPGGDKPAAAPGEQEDKKDDDKKE